MNAEIISVGDELQRGEITNTNSAFLAKKLNSLGIIVKSQVTVGDDPDVIISSVHEGKRQADLIFVCGGLGPTADDVTLSAVAKALDMPLRTDISTWQHLLTIFVQRQIDVQPENKRQAQYVGKLIPNLRGLALGSWVRLGKQRVIILPGPPSEFQAMVEQEVIPMIIKEFNIQKTIKTRALHFLGRPESNLMNDLTPVMKAYPNVMITSYVKPTNIELRLTSFANKQADINAEFDLVTKMILEKENEYYLGMGNDFSLASKVVSLLKQQKLKITGAESLTGGLFQSTICSVPGASEIFDGGFIIYAASAKVKLLGINPTLIEHNGVVSRATAEAMAEYSRERLDADIGLGFTGVAGPDSLEGNPAGTVWLGLARKGKKPISKRLRLAGYLGRQEIRLLSVQYGLQMVLRELESNRTIVR
ncbi:competence/damage-inducible protein A [Limosilactobacillus fastidiosus]|uniref:Putative competence-damage inducible protein n=1 Tax=Limosilactobacillus fastidiosus TaxID=2759855 RepID=A0A7W3TYK7_9LACO|nr:competence/damage-inducible protein A [Limosilactobacillus fastidiosus]MBB1063078.1 competence/damage-inducible protein A [Limosilactobacillus fastidiosus]MBB1085669.1 competence/damage-inducible protein A [Limosilactobacillus fastidiosus]MCD7083841.1 competence/damage-inducible protein A [Limosilactobacillus fastidiosus]MCD7086148.1 competence/damage-inducible protein A [Limosilactobacillus fastidiosus]MCD7114009.1 competence/damage-inducible protein A [Limosilactobacillus fastidiosus]